MGFSICGEAVVQKKKNLPGSSSWAGQFEAMESDSGGSDRLHCTATS